MTDTAAHELAQVNIARLLAPLDSPQLKDFVDALDPVNADAEAADGFVWRLVGDAGDATDVPVFGDTWLIVNMSVWRDLKTLTAFMYRGRHREMLARRREFFARIEEAMVALWWVPAGHRPTVAEAEDRILHLRAHGPTPYAFTLRTPFPAGAAAPVTGEAPEGLGCSAV
ncbi:DUF3291 domain-containing protein [Streptomyces sp. NPDC012461]|jgi:hypothetical protein|uniref:DUF3291 domain-containing protein n=2 Tax=unclassified Streptomyces TaxID=2593676 RepID=A0A6G3QMN7_9ACTN|nr:MULTISPECIES: DUF3291 domain-containing protein [unclassified Streptomyces]MBM7089164.1 DUF3291 domain-containing protein [Streptomyces sp. S12]NEA84641.1 DUF3291 domain-containing protein [Streptomyces sp. SID14436]NEC79768.1 DUF3291 domain-containing protein [Streptomyces sp. SID7958]NED19702.1 DUF3291 domain-containing protein [Streptomyces sp. SID9913]